jgi:hypothetical protein
MRKGSSKLPSWMTCAVTLTLCGVASTAAAAPIASITYTVQGGSASSPFNTVSIQSGGTVTSTPDGGSLRYVGWR